MGNFAVWLETCGPGDDDDHGNDALNDNKLKTCNIK